MRKRTAVAAALILAALLPTAAAQTPPSGIEGRVIFREEVLPGALVYVYRSFEDLLAYRPAFVSPPTIDNGKFTMDVPPGTYFLAAKKRAAGPADGPPAAGDYFCYHGSNPISVAPGVYAHVGFAAVMKESEIVFEPGGDPASGSISGTLTYDGEPLAGAVVQLYLDGHDQFRGQVYAMVPPTGKSGAFRFDLLPENSYFLIARKRLKGGSGPLSDGDFFGYWLENPVPVKAGRTTRLVFEVMSKAGEIGKDDSFFRESATVVRGRIVDAKGAPVPGVYAFAYREKVMSHKRPAFISREADALGNFILYLAEGGIYYIGARTGYGEGPAIGEWYGRYDDSADHSLVITTGRTIEGIVIVVAKIAAP